MRTFSMLALLLLFAAQGWADEPRRPNPPILTGAPAWLANYRFPVDEFRFVRIKYSSLLDRGRTRALTDWPDADIHLSAQLRQITTLDVAEVGAPLTIAELNAAQHPFAYMSEAGMLKLQDAEVGQLRRYLRGGGFLMADDFWGEAEWNQFYSEMKRVFPDLEPVELPLSHKIFHCVFDLKEKPQVPSIHHALSGRASERADAKEPHYRAFQDKHGRILVLGCHNTDLADGWERAGTNAWYTEKYSMPLAFPMGVNIVFYALTQ